jgi:hypothetical protein
MVGLCPGLLSHFLDIKIAKLMGFDEVVERGTWNLGKFWGSALELTKS